MKKVLPIAIAVGVLSLVACAGLGSCGVVATEADADFDLASPKMAVVDDYDPYCLGAFDSYDAVTDVITRQTAYLELDPFDYRFVGTNADYYLFYYDFSPALSDVYTTSQYYRGLFMWSLGSIYYGSISAATADYLGRFGSSNSSSQDYLQLFVKQSIVNDSVSTPSSYVFPSSYLQYRSTNVTSESGSSWLSVHGEGYYSEGYDDGLADACSYDLTFSNASNFGYQMLKVNYDGVETTYYASTDFQTLTFDRRKPLAFTTSAYNNYGITLSLGDNSYVLDTAQVYYLPYFEGDIVISFTNDNTHFATTPLQFYCGEDYLSLTNIGQVYSNGYAVGYTAGYDTGYSAGYTAGFSSATTTDTGVYIQWDTSYSNNYSYSVKWYEGSTQLGSYTLSSYTPTAYFNRPAGKTYTFMIQSDNSTPFSVRYSASGSSVSQTLTDALAVDNVYYLPYWEGSITLLVVPDPSISVEDSFTFSIDPSELGNVKLGSSYVNGYNIGHSEGYGEGKEDGISIGYDDGYKVGYDAGYDDGKVAGIAIGEASVSEGGMVVSNIFGAIVGVPISILNGLSGLTIWSIPLISVLMSFLFLGLVLWIIRLFV